MRISLPQMQYDAMQSAACLAVLFMVRLVHLYGDATHILLSTDDT